MDDNTPIGEVIQTLKDKCAARGFKFFSLYIGGNYLLSIMTPSYKMESSPFFESLSEVVNWIDSFNPNESIDREIAEAEKHLASLKAKKEASNDNS